MLRIIWNDSQIIHLKFVIVGAESILPASLLLHDAFLWLNLLNLVDSIRLL